ncbi:MAG: S8 family serine peptidase [Pyrinomonadaceae bacterium]|nr:S8 family serine peptidase [Pyrinomonadaceae bacterium]
MKLTIKLTTAFILIFALTSGQFLIISAQQTQITPPKYPNIALGRGSGSKSGSSETEKLTPELRMLYAQYRKSGAKGNSESPVEIKFNDEQLKEVFGIKDAGNANPMVAVAVTMNANTDISALKNAGMKVFMRQGKTIYGQASVLSLAKIAGDKTVSQIAATKSAKAPDLPKETAPPMKIPSNSKGANSDAPNQTIAPKKTPLANEFNKAAMTGKGVIVGVIDSGIDWRHKDFLKPDGTSRIIAIWDLFDDSFAQSGGKIGTSPPSLIDGGDALPGTIYTNANINAALKGKSTVNTVDNQGHGTATAGTAAGNGGSAGASFAGVAPEADLIIVKASDCGGFVDAYIFGAKWMVNTANEMKRPIVVNQSFGGHFTAHNGTEQEEIFLNSLTGKGIPGVIFTVSAGNEGQYSMHAAGQFGPRRAGQADVSSKPLSVTIPADRAGKDGTVLLGVFDSRDEWGAIIQPVGATVFTDKDGKPISFSLFKVDGELRYLLDEGVNKPDWFDAYLVEVLSNSKFGDKNDTLAIGLPPGAYRIWGFGATDKVTSGNFDFYAPNFRAVDFGMGTTKTGMVGSPGNASNVITVAAYNFRSSWLNTVGGETRFNFAIGEIADYSSPGGKRAIDGVYKPDIAAPANYTISPLSQTANLDSQSCQGESMAASLGKSFVTADGTHIAWNGTSAASPFTAGVIALMLQKNPNLDAEQVRQILIKTAKKGGSVGAVPNPNWGYGMLDAAAALQATPLPKRAVK